MELPCNRGILPPSGIIGYQIKSQVPGMCDLFLMLAGGVPWCCPPLTSITGYHHLLDTLQPLEVNTMYVDHRRNHDMRFPSV